MERGVEEGEGLERRKGGSSKGVHQVSKRAVFRGPKG